jgi:hypothetical protein
MGMYIAPNAGDGSGLGEDGVNEFHACALISKTMLAEPGIHQKRPDCAALF